MKETTTRMALRARLVFPIASPPIDGGVITIDDGRIVAVGENASPRPAVDLGDVALLPGLVNPHAHLEFSDLHAPLGMPGMPFPQWVEAVVDQRRREVDQQQGPLSAARRPVAVQRGLRESLQAGVTAVGNITTRDVTDSMLPTHGPHCFEFRELLGLSEERIAEQLELARADLARPASNEVARGLSPHAPYTTAPELVQRAVTLARKHQLNLAMHLAESPEELRLLSRGDGPFRDVLQRLGAWNPTVFPGNRQPGNYLRMLAAAPRALIIHGNFLGPEDWAVLSRHRRSMFVVYCPRTHHYFRYPPYPLGRILHAGARVVLGTDGKASNPDLEGFKELQFAGGRHPDVSARALLRMMTLDAADALGWAKRMGSLEPGKNADLIMVKLGRVPTGSADPHATLLDEETQVCGVYLGGIRQ
ncbi:MAG: amidohydrolase family protein [Planctomycetota bacterium]